LLARIYKRPILSRQDTHNGTLSGCIGGRGSKT